LDNPILIAEKELAEHKLPMKIQRVYPSGEIREFAVSDMEY
jgi:hypothetical protein